MKKLFLAILMVTASHVSQAQDATNAYCRPVTLEDKDSAYFIIEEGKDTIAIFKDEWFQTTKKDKAIPVIGQIGFLNEISKVLSPQNQEEVSNHQRLKDISVVRYEDSLYVKVPKTQDVGWYYVIDQSNNKLLAKDTIFDRFVGYDLSYTSDTCVAVRLSPENRVCNVIESVIIASDTLSRQDTVEFEGGKEILTIKIAKHKGEIITEYVQSKEIIKEEAGLPLVWIIVGGVAFLFVVGGGTYFLIRKKRKKAKDGVGRNSGDGSGEGAGGDDVSVPKVEDDGLNIRELQGRIKELQTDITIQKRQLDNERTKSSELQGKYDRLKASRDEEIDKAKKNAEEKAKNEIEKAKRDAQKDIDKAKGEKDKALQERDAIKQKVTEAYEAKLGIANSARLEAEQSRDSYKGKLDQTTAELNSTIQTLTIRTNEVERLKVAQEEYTKRVVFVDFAEPYAKILQELIVEATNVVNSAVELSEKPLDDPYHILKAITKYTRSTAKIEMKKFYTDVCMISGGRIVMSSTTLASYDQNGDKKVLEDKMRQYFFDQYLEKFIDALVVLNESMAGVHRLVDGLSSSDTKVFEKSRETIGRITGKLGIQVDTVKLFDKIGNKIDLSATLVDAGFNPGDIIEIENCIVYFEGGRVPNTKIKVKVQE